MDIKEIALKAGYSTVPAYWLSDEKPIACSTSNLERLVSFAEALIAEIAKQNEPFAFLHEWIEFHPLGDTFAGEPCTTITNDEKPFDSSDTVSPIYIFPPTAEQIANETAEACAKYVNRFINGDGILNEVWISDIESALRNGEWRKHMKGD